MWWWGEASYEQMEKRFRIRDCRNRHDGFRCGAFPAALTMHRNRRRRPVPARCTASYCRSIPPEIPPGPNVEIYSKHCLLCHTARYVAMQPGFPKSVWQSEVKKMVDAYGAPIPDADQVLIVEYLVVVKGVETPASAPAPPK